MTKEIEARLWSVEGNTQRLDGGAMFGNAPRALWSRWTEVDDLNRIPLACRALLVQEKTGRNILLEAGIGAFFPPRLRERFGIMEERHLLLDNLAGLGIEPKDIDVVVLSHLHFDHAGGVLEPWSAGSPPRLCFPSASYVVGAGAWRRARNPHVRDRASFIPELPGLLESTGRLEVLVDDRSHILGPGYRFHLSDGHTPGMILTEIETDRGPILFCADLIPGTPWVHLPITMGYDRYPERLVDEKRARLEDLLRRDGSLFFTHDPKVAMGRVARDDRGRFALEEPLEKVKDLHIVIARRESSTESS